MEPRFKGQCLILSPFLPMATESISSRPKGHVLLCSKEYTLNLTILLGSTKLSKVLLAESGFSGRHYTLKYKEKARKPEEKIGSKRRSKIPMT